MAQREPSYAVTGASALQAHRTTLSEFLATLDTPEQAPSDSGNSGDLKPDDSKFTERLHAAKNRVVQSSDSTLEDLRQQYILKNNNLSALRDKLTERRFNENLRSRSVSKRPGETQRRGDDKRTRFTTPSDLDKQRQRHANPIHRVQTPYARDAHQDANLVDQSPRQRHVGWPVYLTCANTRKAS
ncbi:hypothetical protein HBH70_050410 [Parastagonospora nodorum]|nr:hypothetical protein HBH53_085280 [Parastagonospora nodorum]KAH4308493.1 hypothetical protein HBI01_041070 [Parastagonospora nodorum]KAH4314084.1 hypothetical protein HBI02_068550 [Parastagonospora nodorum]KAH4333706.1 hypothetical protein HBI00_039240 [Parastagonospora nodorum]KAH4379310.1 hypothetical protein HBH94_081230 [Parastagonospora nodorum]